MRGSAHTYANSLGCQIETRASGVNSIGGRLRIAPGYRLGLPSPAQTSDLLRGMLQGNVKLQGADRARVCVFSGCLATASGPQPDARVHSANTSSRCIAALRATQVQQQGTLDLPPPLPRASIPWGEVNQPVWWLDCARCPTVATPEHSNCEGYRWAMNGLPMG